MVTRIGVDVGGTFTDLVLLGEAGEPLEVHKLPTSPDVVSGIVNGLSEIIGSRNRSDVASLAHGTTVATNAVLEGKWGRTVLLTTAGFRDVIEIRKQIRPDDYDLHVQKPKPVIPRRRRLEIDERMTATGEVLVPINGQEIEQVVDRLKSWEIDSVAICFLHSYLNPENERDAAEIVNRLAPDILVTTSSDLVPEFREYPRTSTTMLNAALRPVMESYLSLLEDDVRNLGVPVDVGVLGSDGGVMSLKEGRLAPIRTLSSGPSAGVTGAISVLGSSGIEDFVTFDMGGTSTDVCLVAGAVANTTYERDIAGYPVRYTSLDIHSIGAGGGSIASVDDGGLLAVGPRSAGALPGPACYGRGGTRATVTDANAVLGRLNPISLLGGRMKMDLDAARAAVGVDVAERLGVSVEDAALGVMRVLTNNIVRAIRLISVERGYDPREFWLVGFGGAGPLHAVEVAQEIGFRGVVLPRHPGLLCAAGVLVADVAQSFSRTRLLSADELDQASETIAELIESAKAWAVRNGLGDAPYSLNVSADMRYRRQSSEVSVPLGVVDAGALSYDEVKLAAGAADSFDAVYRAAYGYTMVSPVEFVTFRVRLVAHTERAVVDSLSNVRGGGGSGGEARGARPIVFADGEHEAVVYDRSTLREGEVIPGPAVVEQLDSTCLIPPGVVGTVDAAGNVRIPL